MSAGEIEVDGASEERWNVLVKAFEDASIYQSWAYGAVRWGEHKLSHLVLKQDGVPVGAAQVCIWMLPLNAGGFAYIPWGPLWRRRGSQSTDGVFSAIIRALREEYVQKRGLLLRVAPSFSGKQYPTEADVLAEHSFHRSQSHSPYRTLVLDLSPTLEEIRKNLKQKWRNQLNKAEKIDLEVISGTGDDMYSTFLDLQREMMRRKRYNTEMDYEEFGRVQERLPEDLKMKIFTCKSAGEPMCVTIISAIGSTAIYLLGASATGGMKLNGSNLVHWRIIQWLKENGYQTYDLGGIDPGGNKGVFRFKIGIAGKSGQELYHLGHFESWRNPLSHLAVRLGESLLRLKRRFL